MIKFDMELNNSEKKYDFHEVFENEKDFFDYIRNLIYKSLPSLYRPFYNEVKSKLLNYKDFYNLFACTAKRVLYTELIEARKESCDISIDVYNTGEFIKDFWRGDSHSIDDLQMQLFSRDDILPIYD